MSEHVQGRKHQNKTLRLENQNATRLKRPLTTSTQLAALENEDELFEELAAGVYQNVVVLTGAGVSTAAGIPDFRSPGNGLFARLRDEFGGEFPMVHEYPEYLLSRTFVRSHPDVWDKVWAMAQIDVDGVEPTDTHRFCAWLEHKGWLKRVYTQNIDGLHIHPDLVQFVPTLAEKVVECHGSVARGNLVLYGDDLPNEFYSTCDQDFESSNSPISSSSPSVDLVLVFGTSLQVAPFCGVPNMAPKGCTRVLVNRCLDECLQNDFSRGAGGSEGLGVMSSTRIGNRKAVSLKALWASREGRKKWRQLLVESDCDDFCQRFFASQPCQDTGHSLHEFQNAQLL